MFGDMKVIEQEKPASRSIRDYDDYNRDRPNLSASLHRATDIDDDFDTIIRFSTGPPK